VSIRVRVSDAAAGAVHLAYSPVLEAVLSLSVLVQPSHHPLHHEWVRSTRRCLPSEMKQKVADFRFSHMDYIPAGLLPQRSDPYPDFEGELERIRSLPLEEQSIPILRNLVGGKSELFARLDSPEAREEVLERGADLGSATVELLKLGLEDPRQLAEGFLDGLTRYWQVCFREEWERIEPKLAATTDEASQRLADGGLYAMLEGLRPRIGLNREAGEFWLRRAHEVQIMLDDRAEILFVPSAFIWPHIGLAHDPPGRLAVIYAAPFASYESSPESLDGFVPLMRALGDPTRLRVLKLIAERPRSTQELARLITISESAMSKHLRQLTRCGVLVTERDSYYQLYYLVRERVEPLSARLLEFLESDQ
jgi:DNA-binding transcriptional ArsR family regulator